MKVSELVQQQWRGIHRGLRRLDVGSAAVGNGAQRGNAESWTAEFAPEELMGREGNVGQFQVRCHLMRRNARANQMARLPKRS